MYRISETEGHNTDQAIPSLGFLGQPSERCFSMDGRQWSVFLIGVPPETHGRGTSWKWKKVDVTWKKYHSEMNHLKKKKKTAPLYSYAATRSSLAFGFSIFVLFDSYLMLIILQSHNASTMQKSAANGSPRLGTRMTRVHKRTIWVSIRGLRKSLGLDYFAPTMPYTILSTNWKTVLTNFKVNCEVRSYWGKKITSK